MVDVLRRPRPVVTAADRLRDALGRVRRGERPGLVPPADRLGRGSRPSTAGRRTGSSPTARRRADRRPGPRPPARARCRGASPTRRAVRSPARWTPDAHRRVHRARPRRAAGATPAASRHLRIDPEIEARRAARPRRRAPRGAARRRLAAGAADPAERDPGHRPARPTRTRSGATCARSGASTSTRRGPAGVAVVDAERRPARRVLPDLPRDRRPGRVPDPGRVRLPRRLGGVRARPGDARLLFAQTADGEPLATLFLVRCGPRVVEPYGGMTAAGGESRANYLLKWEAIRIVARGRAHELRPVGPRDRRDRPLQDRVRRPRGPLHRRLGPRARPARAAGLRARAARRASWLGAAARTALGGGGERRRAYRRRRGLTAAGADPRDATADELADWDARAVDAPGGHVYQSRAWAAHRRASAGSRASSSLDDGGRALALTRPWPVVGGAQRLRAARARSRPATGRRARSAAARWSRVGGLRWPTAGVDVVAADPEVPAADAALSRARSRRPASTRSRRSSRRATGSALPLAGGRRRRGRPRGHRQVDPPADPRRPRRDGVVVVRHDARAARTGAGEGFARPTEPPDVALDRFYDLLLETGERRAVHVRAARGVRRLVAARARGRPPRLPRGPRRAPTVAPLGGLVLYRHGGRLSTVHSGDHAGRARDAPGRHAPAALAGDPARDPRGLRARWTSAAWTSPAPAASPARASRCTGLYQHKRSFGGEWLELAGAHERVIRAAAATRLGRALRGAASARTGRPMTERDRSPSSSPPPSRPSPRPLGGLDRAPRPPRAACAAPGATAGRSAPAGLADVAVRGVTDDSRAVRAGLAVRGRARAPRRRPRLRRPRRPRPGAAAAHRRAAGPRGRRCRSSSSTRRRPALATRRRLVVRRPERTSSASSGSPARTARRRPRSSPSPRSRRPGVADRHDRHGRDPDRRRPGGQRGARHDARGARAPARAARRWSTPATRRRSSRRPRTGSRSTASRRSPTTSRS